MDQYHQTMLALVRAALQEDVGPGDLTSLACLEPGPVSGKIVAKSSGILSGVEPARLVFHIVDSANELVFEKRDGDPFAPGDVIARFQGFNQSVLVSERTALNFMAHLSGIATLTNRFVTKLHQAGQTSARILDTRKTTPGWRLLEKRAVLHGGGHNHRIGLYDQVLIKDNHIAGSGGITGAVHKTRGFLGSAEFRAQFGVEADKIKIEVEVETEAQVREAIEAGVDRLLLDNQTPASLRTLVELARSLDSSVELEASGNVSLETVVDIAATGVDFISIGALTHSAPVSDFSMKVQSEPYEA